jgi:transcriptional regulator of acetoin/glycerol metabolism
MSAQARTRHAADVETAITSGQAAKSALVASWRRSYCLHQLDPSLPRKPLRLTHEELQQARERIEPLIRAAQPGLDHLHQALGTVGCCVLLADRAGVPVDRRGAAGDDATFEAWGLWTGAVWSEEREGTNGIGTCLVEKRPLTIDRDQHFLSRNIAMSCTAVPIYDPEARLAGVVDVSSCRTDRTDAFASLISLVLAESARVIEAGLFRNAFAKARIILAPPSERGPGGLIAIDSDDLVIGATRSTRLALGLAPEGELSPVPAADLLGEPSAAREQLGDHERGVLQRALLRSHGNVSAAAQALGISRATLHRRLKRCELRAH